MGHGSPLLPVAPSRGGWHAVLTAWLPACLVPVTVCVFIGVFVCAFVCCWLLLPTEFLV